jgi:hypothetical protein
MTAPNPEPCDAGSNDHGKNLNPVEVVETHGGYAAA